MKVIVLLVSQVVYALVSTFNISCPHRGQWKYRANYRCPEDAEKFVCLFDVINKHYAENCNGPLRQQIGDKTVINIYGRFDTEECAVERYQPIVFPTTDGSDCLYEKTSCNEEGQVRANNGSRKKDRLCTCDYRKGYAFVSVNRTNPCSCIPAEEDCSCYLKLCGHGQRLSTDFQCVKEENFYDLQRYSCPVISRNEKNSQREESTKKDILVVVVERSQYFVFYGDSVRLDCRIIGVAKLVYWQREQNGNIQNITKHTHKYAGFSIQDPSLIISNADYSDSGNYSCYGGNLSEMFQSLHTELFVIPSGIWYNLHTALIVSGFVFIIILFVLLVPTAGWIDRKFINCMTKFDFITSLKETICLKDHDVSFICEVTKHDLSATWSKDNETIEPGDTDSKYKITSKNRVHTLEIKKVDLNDRGNYSVRFKNHQQRSASLIVLDGMSENEYLFFKVFVLIQQIAFPVVRMHFNSVIHPGKLQETLSKSSSSLNKLKRSGQLSLAEFDLLYPRKVIYEVSFMFINEEGSDVTRKNDRNESFIEKIKREVLQLYQNLPGKQEVEKLQLVEPKCLLVSLTLTFNGEFDDEEVQSVLLSAVNNGSIPPFHVMDMKFLMQSCQAESSKYRATFMICNETYTKELEDNTSAVFIALSSNVKKSVMQLYTGVSAVSRVDDIEFKPVDLVGVVEFILMSKDFSSEEKLREVIDNAVNQENVLSFTTVKSSLSFRFYKNERLKPSSDKFDIRLMILLLRNILDYDIVDSLPPDANTNVDADLSRIKFYRNKIVHMSERQLTKEEYDEIWLGLKNPICRLGNKKYKQMVLSMKMMRSSSQNTLIKFKRLFSNTDGSDKTSADNLNRSEYRKCSICEENMPQLDLEKHSDLCFSITNKETGVLEEGMNDNIINTLHTDIESVNSHHKQIAYLLNRLVDRAGKVKFDTEFPSELLKQSLNSRKKDLDKLYSEKKLTQTQWEYLFPRTGIPLSENIEFQLRIRLMWILKGTMKRQPSITSEDYEDFNRLKTLTDNLRKLSYSESEQEEIIQILRRLGGENYLQIYERQRNSEEDDNA